LEVILANNNSIHNKKIFIDIAVLLEHKTVVIELKVNKKETDGMD